MPVPVLADVMRRSQIENDEITGLDFFLALDRSQEINEDRLICHFRWDKLYLKGELKTTVKTA